MHVADLRHRVTVESRTETASGDGVIETWSALRDRVAATVKPLQGRDLERANQVDPRISHLVTLRYWQAYRTDLDGGRARVVYHPSSNPDEDRVFEIIGAPIDVAEWHDRVEMNCRELV
jgi:head-tail adaptor